jgi:hypothetical protein
LAQRPATEVIEVEAMLEIVVNIGVSSLYEVFDEANYFFQFVALD